MFCYHVEGQQVKYANKYLSSNPNDARGPMPHQQLVHSNVELAYICWGNICAGNISNI